MLRLSGGLCLLILALCGVDLAARSTPAGVPLPAVEPCPVATAVHRLPGSAGPLLPPAAASAQDPTHDYRHRLASTAHGWPRLQHWCIWIEPSGGDPAGRLWEERWQQAVLEALQQWQEHLSIQRVSDPNAAQVRLRRRRPPLIPGPDGRSRASHGRATLQLLRIERAGVQRLEPAVEVLISPGQRQEAIAATALHELGHAFGLWGHSEDPADAMAVAPGPRPVLRLSERDRATLRWLQSQPTAIGVPLPP